MRVMQLVSLSKVCEGDHAWKQGEASPPEVRSLRATKMAVNAFMGHNRAEKYQIGAEQNVYKHQQGIGCGDEKCTYR